MKSEVIEGAKETGIAAIDRWLRVNSRVIDGVRDYNTSDVDIDELINIAHDLAKGLRGKHPLPSHPVKVVQKFTRLGWNGMCYVEMKNGIVYSRKEVDAWLRRYMSKETRA